MSFGFNAFRTQELEPGVQVFGVKVFQVLCLNLALGPRIARCRYYASSSGSSAGMIRRQCVKDLYTITIYIHIHIWNGYPIMCEFGLGV